MRHCVICGQEFPDELDAVDHGPDYHGLFHFMNPTIPGPPAAGVKYAETDEELTEAVNLWEEGYWSAADEYPSLSDGIPRDDI